MSDMIIDFRTFGAYNCRHVIKTVLKHTSNHTEKR